MERMWSKIGRFSKITKEMTPENRSDFLAYALLHESQKAIIQLGRHHMGGSKRNYIGGKWSLSC